MVCSLDEKFSDAEQFFELSTTADPTNIVAWAMRGVCSDTVFLPASIEYPLVHTLI